MFLTFRNIRTHFHLAGNQVFQNVGQEEAYVNLQTKMHVLVVVLLCIGRLYCLQQPLFVRTFVFMDSAHSAVLTEQQGDLLLMQYLQATVILLVNKEK